jgi:hypothetical protein
MSGRASISTAVEEQRASSMAENHRYYTSQHVRPDRDREDQSIKATAQCNDFLLLLANQPSLGLYRVHEHVRRSVPEFRQRRQQLESASAEIEGCVFDLDYAVESVKEVAGARRHVRETERLLAAAIATRQAAVESAKGLRS